MAQGPSFLGAVVKGLRDVFSRGQAPSAPASTAPPPTPLANLPKPTKASPWGSPTYLDYWTGGITTESVSRNRNNVPLYYDAQNNHLTHNQTPIRAYFGLNAKFEPALDQILNQSREQYQELVRMQSAAQIAQASATRLGYPTEPPPTQYPDYYVRESSMAQNVQQLSKLYQTGEIDTPAGQAKQEEILDTYSQYAKPEARVVDVHGLHGEIVSVPLRNPEEKQPAAWYRSLMTWGNNLRNRIGLNPIGVGSVSPYDTILDSLPQGFQDFRDNFWGGNLGTDIDVTLGVARSAIEEFTQASPVAETTFTFFPALFNSGPTSTLKSGISMGWNHAMNLLNANPLWGKSDYDPKKLAQMPRDLFRLAIGMNPYVMMARGVTDAYEMAGIALTGDYKPAPFTTFSIFGVSASQLLRPSTDAQRVRREALLNNLATSIDRIRNEGLDFKTAEEIKTERETGIALNKNRTALMEYETQLMGQLRQSMELAESFNDLELGQSTRERLRASAERYWTALEERTDVTSHAFRYSWVWAPDGEERKLAARNAIIEAMVVKGRPLYAWEVAEVTNRFTEAGSEFVGEAIFDPTNLIPGAVFDDMARFGFRLGKKALRGVFELPLLPLKIAENLPLGRISTWSDEALEGIREFFTSRALASKGVHLGHQVSEALIVIRNSVSDNDPRFYEALGDVFKRLGGEQVDLSKYGLLSRSLHRLEDGLKTLDVEMTYERFVEVVGTTLDRKGLAHTARNFTDEAPEALRDFYMARNRIKGMYGVGALNEGMYKNYLKLGLLDPGSRTKALLDLNLRAQHLFRRIWTPLVLTLRPGYVITNTLDNMMRAGIAGANLLLSFDTVLDDLERNVPDAVKGGFAGTFNEESSRIADRLIRGELNTNFLDLFVDGFKEGWGGSQRMWGKLEGSLKQGFAQVNAASEFVFRTRVYHHHYVQNMSIIKKLLQEHALVRLSELGVMTPETANIVRQALIETGRIPTKIIQQLNGTEGRFSKLITEEIYKRWQTEFGPAVADGMAQRVTAQLQQLVEQGRFNVENIGLIFEDIRTNGRRTLEESLSLADQLGKHPELDALDPQRLPEVPTLMAEPAPQSIQERIVAKFEEMHPEPHENANQLLTDIKAQPAPDGVDRLLWAKGNMATETRAAAEAVAQDMGISIDELTTQFLDEPGAAQAAEKVAEAAPVHATTDQAVTAANVEVDAFLKSFNIDPENVPENLKPQIYKLVSAVKNTVGNELRVSTAQLRDGVRSALADAQGKIDRLQPLLNEAQEIVMGTKPAGRAEVKAAQQEVQELIKKQQALTILVQYEDAIDKAMRGPMQGFLAEVFPGAARQSREGFPTQRAWQIYNEAEARSLFFHLNENKKMMDMMSREAWDEMLAIQVPTRAEVLKQMGWTVNFGDDGRLLSITLPTGQTSSAFNPQFQQFFGFMNQQQFEALPFTEVIPPHYAFAPAGAPGSTQSYVEGLTRTEAWNVLLSKNVDIGGRSIPPHLFLEYYLGPEAMTSVENFRAAYPQVFEGLRQSGDIKLANYLKDMFEELDWQYNQIIQMSGYTGASPARLQLHYLSPSMQSKLRAGQAAAANYASMNSILDDWMSYLGRAIDSNDWYVQVIDKAQRDALGTIGSELGQLLDDGLEVANNGGSFMGQNIRGAIPEMNRMMIDYENFTPLDRFIKDNIFPFWMFPSRTLPMWAQTMAAKPWIAAAYSKLQRYSQREAYEHGAVTRSGDQLPSLRGYIPVPGTDVWFDPTQVMSMRYVFPEINQYNEDKTDRGPLQEIANFAVRKSQIFGLFPHPLVMLGLNFTGFLDTNEIPRYPLVPQFKLIPPFIENYMISQLRQLGPAGRVAADVLDPEVGYKDFLIARRILRKANEAIATMSPEEAQKLAERARSAIDYVARSEDPELQKMWDETKNELDGEEWQSSLMGYMTAFYGKTFTTADANFIMIRQEIDMLKSSLNDAAQATIFDLPVNVTDRNLHYTRLRYETPQGFLANTYNLVSHVPTPEGTQAYGKEWEQIVSQNIHEEQQDESAYMAIDVARKRFEAEISGIPIGSKRFYEAIRKYSATLSQIDQAYPSSTQPGGRFFGYKPEYLVFNDLVSMIWRYWGTTIPRYDPDSGEKYVDFKKRKEDWINTLGDEQTRSAVVLGFLTQNFAGPAVRGTEPAIRFLNSQMNWPADFEQRAIDALTPEGYKAFVMKNDTEYEALLNAWEAIVWDPKWAALEGLSGHERNLASMQYDEAIPEGQALNEQLIEWVKKEYGADKFDPKKLNYILQNVGTTTTEERMLEGKDESALTANNLWDELARIPPGQHQSLFLKELERIYRANGKDERDASAHLNAWYVSDGRPSAFGSQEDFKFFNQAVTQAIAQRKYPELSEAELKEFVEAENLNKKLKASVEKRLGADFYSFQDDYYAMTPEQRRAFRDNFPDAYKRIVAYNDMRDEFATQYPTWAKYYHREVVAALESGKSLADALEEIGVGTGGGGGRGGGSSRGTGTKRGRAEIPPMLRPGFRGGQTGPDILGRLGRGGVAARAIWPTHLLETIGSPAASEVEKAAGAGQELSPALKNYLKNLDAHEARNITEEVEKVYKKLSAGGGGVVLKQ